MPHSASESIAALASALAKAQRALVNPEKTMIATVRDGRGGQGSERSFRYAPLSAGLEIVRNTLGENEIAVMQTTTLDEGKTTVLLKTMLAHSSGEWIASDWPVCPLSEVSSPQRMGAALTYARRYALFTMVGIAGEDDLDAPDLQHAPGSATVTNEPRQHPGGAEWGRSDGGRTSRPAGGRFVRPPRPAILAAEPSAARRATLLTELHGLASAEDAVTWAKRVLPEKNQLMAEDANLLEQAFAERMRSLEHPQEIRREIGAAIVTEVAIVTEAAAVNDPVPKRASLPDRAEARSESQRQHGAEPQVDDPALSGPVAAEHPDGKQRPDFPQRLPASPVSLQKTRRRRDPEHLRFVAAQPCLICARTPSDAHHLRFAQVRALGRKASDEFTVPLCRTHHREAHRASKEPAWWARLGVSPIDVAQKLWRQSQGGTGSGGLISRRRKAPNGLAHSGRGNGSSPQFA